MNFQGIPMEGLPPFIEIHQNEFLYRKHKKQKEEDIATCECMYDASDPESACGERCLNVLTNTECTPGYCPCGTYCKNQRFQKCDYARIKLFKTEGRGWGVLADENIKAGSFIIEYCGEVISWKEAKSRSQSYETQGLKDAYIISLDSHESIDATMKGSFASEPNCETRKWNVLGEVRVGIFAKCDIPIGTELGYDYNFEWYGGTKVRCLCGAPSCSGFLGAKSRGFQEDTYLWEDDDDRYSVEKIPLYDSAEDEPSSKFLKIMDASKPEFATDGKNEGSMMMVVGVEYGDQLESNALAIEPLDTLPPMKGVVDDIAKTEVTEMATLFSQDTQQAFAQKNAIISRNQSNTACQNHQIGPGPLSKKKSLNRSRGRPKLHVQRKLNAVVVTQLLESKEAQDEVLNYEVAKNLATSKLDTLYNEIRPAIEEHERDSQDSVPTSVGEKWIEASCSKLKAEFDLYSCVIKNIVCNPQKSRNEARPPELENENQVMYLTN
ncbi:AWS domain [Dillenia turbinata]|uniref:AWS domain n=1 Tax=Dillenia turbinata TaxID=194707 RepID=A0AAN8ZL99_9MAGN